MRTVRDHRITVVGGRRSGVAVARLLSRAGATVFVTDQAAIPTKNKEILVDDDVSFEDEGHTKRAEEADMIVLSPGVPSDAPLVRSALQSSVPVYSELEVASWFCRAPIVAVTGTNGKTTTTELTGFVFRKAGVTTFVAGNVGVAFSSIVADASEEDVVVLEVSSFQLDHVVTFRPRVSVLLNITPDHLNRYADFEAYAASKYRIVERQKPGDVFIYNHDDPVVARFAHEGLSTAGPTRLAISLEGPVDAGGFLDGDNIVLSVNEREVLMHRNEVALRGRHNLYNSLAAAVAARAMEVRSDVIRESIATFEGVPHRLELVRDLHGVLYYNDSKATNVNALWYALESFREPIVLIAGGRDKGNDYSQLLQLVRTHVKAVIAIGESAEKVLHQLGAAVDSASRAESLEEAVELASVIADSGDVVLLSPACASFDMFDNYEERGNAFKRAVATLG